MPRVSTKDKTPSGNKTSSAKQRPQRVPVSGYRDKLSVYNKDPGYYYKWVYDSAEGGGRILQYKRAGFEFARPDEHVVGQDMVFASNADGSVIRNPEPGGGFLYLMRQPMEFREEDLALHHDTVDLREGQIKEPGAYNETGEDLGQYGPGAEFDNELLVRED